MTDLPLRIVFAGTPDFAAVHLAELINKRYNIVAVFSQPDRPVGRGKKVRPTPVKQAALAHGIPVFQPEKLTLETAQTLSELAPDVIIVVAYGLILGKDILKTPRFGCLNVHASLLPRWRGAAPIERAILAGDSETGISIMQMDEGLDTGDVLLHLTTPIIDLDDAESISSRLSRLGIEGLDSVLQDLPAFQSGAEQQQASQATYAAKLTKDEAQIKWHSPAIEIQHQVQAFFPRSPAYCFYKNDRLRIIKAVRVPAALFKTPGTILHTQSDLIQVACGEDALEIRQIQLPGKKPLLVKELFHGHGDFFLPGNTLDEYKSLE